MSRSGYNEDIGNDWSMIMYRGAVTSAVRGRRGQKFLRDLLTALDALPEKKLIKGELECDDGVCALGALGRARSIPMEDIDPEHIVIVAGLFDIAEALAREVVYENDEAVGDYIKETPEARFVRVRRWVVENIREAPA